MQLVTLPVPNPLPPSLELAPSPSTDLAVDQQQVPKLQNETWVWRGRCSFWTQYHQCFNYEDSGGCLICCWTVVWWFMMISLQCSGIQRLDILRCTMVAVFLWIQGAVCFNFASTNGARQERENRKSAHARPARAPLPLFFTPLSFLFSYHTTSPTTRTPPSNLTVLCGNLCLSSHLLFHWPASITSSGLKSLADIASLVHPTIC